MSYETIVGLEIHVELSTNTKMFCSCKNEFGGQVNQNTCPVCLGMPGSLPVLNKRALEYAIMAGIAFNCNIAKDCKMDRKNYFYPDLTKGYQISQYDIPLCYDGYLEIENEKEEKKRIRIQRIHIEEDTGKSLHDPNGDTLLDYNRAGLPLIEIVTHPDISSPYEAQAFLEKLKETLLFLGISDVKMEQGSLRCDVNINMKKDENTKTNISELKNLNSFRNAVKALEFEQKRHASLLDEGLNTKKETRRWDEDKQETIHMRSKENVQDYRYFPEPDIVDISLTDEDITNIKNNLEELPDEKRQRFMKDYQIPEYDAKVLTSSREVSSYFEDIAKAIDNKKLVSNWIMTELLRRTKDEEISLDELKFTKQDFIELLKLISDSKINNNAGKKVFRKMFEDGKKPMDIVKEDGLLQVGDESEIKQMVQAVLDQNEASINDYKNGKDRAFGFLVGQVMKASRGKANPQIVNKLLKEILDSL